MRTLLSDSEPYQPAQRPVAERLGRGRACRPRHQDEADATDGAEDDLVTEDVGGDADHRAEERAGDRRAHRGADHLPALLLRRRGGHPAHRAGPGGGAAEALDEAGQVEHDDRLGERERDARAGHQPEADQHRRPHADPRRQPAAREAAHERADRERRGEQAGAGLRQAVLVDEVRQQRRDRRIERRVDQDDDRSEDEQAAHGRWRC